MIEDLPAHPLAVLGALGVIAGSVAAGVTASRLGTQKPGDVPLITAVVGVLLAFLFLGIGRGRVARRSRGALLDWPRRGFYGWSSSLTVAQGLALFSALLRQVWPLGVLLTLYALPVATLLVLCLSLQSELRRSSSIGS